MQQGKKSKEIVTNEMEKVNESRGKNNAKAVKEAMNTTRARVVEEDEIVDMEVEGQGTDFASEDSDMENYEVDDSAVEDTNSSDQEEQGSRNNNATAENFQQEFARQHTSENDYWRKENEEKSGNESMTIDPEEKAFFDRLHYYLKSQGVIGGVNISPPK